MIKCIIILTALSIFISGCSVLQQQSKNELSNGLYSQRIHKDKRIVYMDIEGDTFHVHPTVSVNNQILIDTSRPAQYYLKEVKSAKLQHVTFSKHSFDVDFLTIPLKYRPPQKEVPPQLNTNVNGALYLGFRTDNYAINYVANPQGNADRNQMHFGFSGGIFTGIGNSFISPTNTSNALQQEYDGIVWSKGIAGIVAVNNFTIGLTFGFDNLLDKNHSVWIYQSRPWCGLAFGLNLN